MRRCFYVKIHEKNSRWQAFNSYANQRIICNIFAGHFKIGGMTEAFFTTKGINYIVALVCFCSSAALDFEKIKKVLKKQGSILLVKIILCFFNSILPFLWNGSHLGNFSHCLYCNYLFTKFIPIPCSC